MRLAQGYAEVLLGLAIAYGVSGEHEGFPGTVSVGHEVLAGMLVEIGRSSSLWAAGVLFVSGHGGNARMLVAATSKLRREKREAAWWSCTLSGVDAHAGRTETSLMLVIRPTSVQADRAQPGNCRPIEELMPQLRERRVISASPNGVLGDPTGASAAHGRRLLAKMGRQLRRDFAQWVVGDDGAVGRAAEGTRPALGEKG